MLESQRKDRRPAKKGKKLTTKQRCFVAEYQKDFNATQAAIRAGYPAKTANRVGPENLSKPVIHAAVSQIMDRMGLSDERLLQTLTVGLESTKVISSVIIGKDAGTRTNDFIEVPDFMARHKYLETALKLRGHMKDKLDVNLAVAESYEQRRRRLGLDD